jgi:hypothetical protein
MTTKFLKKVFCELLFEVKITSIFKDKKVIKKSQNNRNKFSYYFCWMMEGFRSGSGRYKRYRSHGSGSTTSEGRGVGSNTWSLRRC